RSGQAVLRPGRDRPCRLQRLLGLDQWPLFVPARGVLGPGDLEPDLRRREYRFDPGDLRMDVRARDLERRPGPIGLVSARRWLCPVLRRSDQLRLARRDVAVVGWGRGSQWLRGLRPDRR